MRSFALILVGSLVITYLPAPAAATSPCTELPVSVYGSPQGTVPPGETIHAWWYHDNPTCIIGACALDVDGEAAAPVCTYEPGGYWHLVGTSPKMNDGGTHSIRAIIRLAASGYGSIRTWDVTVEPCGLAPSALTAFAPQSTPNARPMIQAEFHDSDKACSLGVAKVRIGTVESNAGHSSSGDTHYVWYTPPADLRPGPHSVTVTIGETRQSDGGLNYGSGSWTMNVLLSDDGTIRVERNVIGNSGSLVTPEEYVIDECIPTDDPCTARIGPYTQPLAEVGVEHNVPPSVIVVDVDLEEETTVPPQTVCVPTLSGCIPVTVCGTCTFTVPSASGTSYQTSVAVWLVLLGERYGHEQPVATPTLP